MAEANNLMLLSKLAREEVCQLINSSDEANKLASKLQKIQQVLSDAERLGMTDPRVKRWLDKLQEISYEIDDVLDEWEWENMRIQLEDTSELSSSSDNPLEKVSSFLQSVCLCFKNVVEHRQVNLEIKQLNERLDQIEQENEKFFCFLPNLSRDNSQDFKGIETASFVNVSEVRGRDDEKKNLLSKLLSGSSSSSQTKNDIPVISIVGPGGMGKTTLAQLVFDDDRIKEHFQEKIWVCVSDPFDEIKVATAILNTLNRNPTNHSQLETLLRRIVHNVSGKSFLLVLDDVWTEDDARWKPLREALKHGAPNSRILVTTRKEKVAYVMGSTSMQIQSLNPLSDSDCWEVFSQRAFREKTEQEHEFLNDIGLEIVKKCKGLPLVAKTIGSLLRFESRVEEWRDILERPWWELEIVQREIFAPLALSYDNLHPVAKLCFSYCAIFPKDAKLESDTLIRMWCAQGFLLPILETSYDNMEQKGREIFDNLAMHNFFQDFEKDYVGNHIITCKMHDIVHDFAQFLSKNDCLIVENVYSGATSADVRSVRHLNLLVDEDKLDINSILIDNKKCRSFLTSKYTNIPENLFRHLKRARVLILNNCFEEVIPSEIGSLIHSRYLDLSWSYIKELPVAICDLYFLETLILNFCRNLSAFPQGIHKLRKLRHIFNEGTDMEFPEGTEKLTNLRTLSQIHVSLRTNWKNLEFLRNMNKLCGSLKISVEGLDDENADNSHLLLEAVEKAELKNKKFIQQLVLLCRGKLPTVVVEALQPHPKLEELRFEGPYLPKWLTTLTNLWRLKITITGGMNMGNLKELYTFPKLRELSFDGCREWEEWEDISEEEENNINLSIFQSLQELSFGNCPKLKALPHRLLRRSPCLKHLYVWSGCEKLKEKCQDWERASQIHGISHITAKIV